MKRLETEANSPHSFCIGYVPCCNVMWLNSHVCMHYKKTSGRVAMFQLKIMCKVRSPQRFVVDFGMNTDENNGIQGGQV